MDKKALNSLYRESFNTSLNSIKHLIKLSNDHQKLASSMAEHATPEHEALYLHHGKLSQRYLEIAHHTARLGAIELEKHPKYADKLRKLTAKTYQLLRS